MHAGNKNLGEECPDTTVAKGNLVSTYSDLGKYTGAEKLEIQVLDASSNILGGEYPATITAMKNLAAAQKTMSLPLKMDKADNQVSSTSHTVSMTKGMEGENVDTRIPHVSNRLLGEEDSDAEGAPSNLPSLHDGMIHSQKKGIS